MRNHTLAKIHELVSTGGKNPSFTPGTSVQTAQFLMNSLPVGKDGKLWYYLTAIVVKVVFRITQSGGAGAAMNPDQLYKVLQSVQVQCPLLGQLFLHANTRGATLGNIIQRYGNGYSSLHNRAQVAAANGNTDVTLYFRIPFAYEFLRKPHETSPWTGFLEGGTLEIKLDTSTVFSADSPAVVTAAPCSMRAWMEMIPSPEAVIHTPSHWREHITPGNSTKAVIQDMGSADGLQGIDQSKGVGLAVLHYLTDATNIGLNGPDGADNITGVDIPWRNQDRIDSPDSMVNAMFGHQGTSRQTRNGTHDGAGWPYTIAATPNGDLNDAQALVFPLCAPGRDCETSKLQTVSGAKEINFSYTSTPSGSYRFLGMYFPVFDDNYMATLIARIAPGSSGRVRAKTLNKQAGGVRGVGKLAYTRTKILPG